MRSEIPVQPAIDPTPMAPMAFLDVYDPIVASQTKLANGMTGTRKRSPSTLTPHLAGFVGIEGPILVVKLQDQCQADRGFRSRHSEDEDEHDLTVGLRPASPGCDKRQSGGIEHDLDGHQNENEITPHQQTGHSQREQNPGQHQS